MKLDVVNFCTNRDVSQGQAVTDMDLSFRSVHDSLSNLKLIGSQDVGLLTVSVADQRDVGCSVGIVLDGDNLCRDSIFISLEIDKSVFLLCSAAAMSDSDLALVVAAGVLLQVIC